MSAIITGMDIPKNCRECKWRMKCPQWSSRSLWKEEYIRVRSDDCPIKSIEGLIKEIKNIDLDKSTNDFYGMQKKIIKVIKEYCEVSE